MPESNDTAGGGAPNSGDIGKLLELVRALNVPDARPRVLRTLLRRRRPLPRPVVGLVGVPASSPLLVEIYRWLGESGGRRATPRARVDLSAPGLPADALRPDPNATGEEVEGHCLPIVHRLVEGFSGDDTAMGPIRFPRYRTADWLTRQRVTSDETEATVELRARLPRLLRSGTPAASPGDASEAAAGDVVSRMVFGVLALWPVLRLWLWVSGRIPGMSKVTRWFMHQRYLAPQLSDSFLGFAVRLTASGRNDENEEQVAKLLVNAFLEDLRDAYRRPLWRPSGWRRTAYPVALLGPVAEGSAAAGLLSLINDIRNETGLFDPLVIVACLETAPAEPAPGDLAHVGELAMLPTLESLVDRYPPGQQPDPLRTWLGNIEHMRTSRRPRAWFLPLRVRLPEPVRDHIRDPDYAALAVPPAPPLAARRWFVAMSALLPVVLVAAAAVVWLPPLRGEPCSHWPWTRGVSVSTADGECVGYSDNAHRIFSTNPELRAVQERIFELNRAAERRHEDEASRPLVTLIYFAGFAHDEASIQYPLAQAEELAGVAVQQELWLNNRGPGTPLLRVVIANGGTRMSRAVTVVNKHLADLIADDPGVLGVIGMDRSTAETSRAIDLLGDLGVPVVSTTLSADSLMQVSPLYFQAVPNNARQAALIADYIAGARYPAGSPRAGRRFYSEVELYASADVVARRDSGDIYVTNLIDDLTEELRERGIPFRILDWVDVAPTCRTDDAPETLLFYAARNEEFTNFAQRAGGNCEAGRGPVILGNDTLTRVLADPHAVESIPPWSTVRYVAYAASVMLGGARCRDGEVTGPRPTSHHVQLCQGLPELVAFLRAHPDIDDGYTPNWPGDRLALGYDVVGVFGKAVIDSRPADRLPNRAAVAAQLLQTTYTGASGTLDFEHKRIAERAPIAILATDLRGAEPVSRCLLMYPGAEAIDGTGARIGGTGCPPEPRQDAAEAGELEEWAAPGGN